MVENYLNKNARSYIFLKRRNNTSVCKDIIIKIILDTGKEIGHFEFLHSQLPNYYEKSHNKKYIHWLWLL